MDQKPKKSLKRSFSILLGVQLLLILVLGSTIFGLYLNQHKLAQSRDRHTNSYLLADQLRQSSDDLTRLVRTYVATGNPEYEREYWAVLDIRNGKIPRPVEYNRIYWDFVSATGEKPRADGKAVSLQDLMVEQGFTQEEFDLLALAQKNSDGLVTAETIAFNAMKGLFDDGTGNFTVKKDPDQKMASDLVNNETYMKTKAEIMRPIDDFYIMFETRTGGEVAKYLRVSNIMFLASIIMSIIILVISLLSFIVLRRQIGQREQAENDLDKLNQDLENQVKERTAAAEKSEAKMKETLEESEKLNRFMTGRELKMIELKKKITDLEDKK